MRLAFCGTPAFAVPTLQALHAAGHAVGLVLSQPDRPVGRSAEVLPTPVKQAATALGLPVVQPEKLRNNPDLQRDLQALQPDAIVVVAYGRILPGWMLELPRYGCINGHASLLPRWRGAAPIQWAIASGDRQTGVTTMRLNEGLDTGPMLLKRAMDIDESTTSPQMFERLSHMGAALMVETLAGLEAGSIAPQPQDDAAATLAPILTRDDGRIVWSRSAVEIERRFRGFQPWPGAFTTLRGRKLTLHALRVEAMDRSEPAGTLLVDGGRMLAVCGHGSIVIEELQMEGKRRMPAGDFLRGFQVKPGELLGL